MLRYIITLTFRNIRRHKVYSIINILGLALGLSTGFIILQHVYHETSYDNFFENKENIYRIQLNRYNKEELSTQWAAGCAGAGLHMKEDFPEVVDFVNLHSSEAMISYGKNYFQPEFAYYAGRSFFQIFSIPLLRGVDSTVLRDPFTVALCESMAIKLFGDEDPMGKTIKLNDETDFLVTGIYQDFPEKSHMAFDLLYSFESYVAFTNEQVKTQWMWDGFLNYVLLKDGTDPEILEAKFPDWVMTREGEQLQQMGEGMEFLLQPLPEIHLTSDYRGEIKPTGDKTSTYFLLIIGMIVLVIAWINYVNLTTARSINRAKEVGIRKVLGSFRSQLIRQFLIESSIINLLALSFAVLFVVVAYPYFNDFIGRSSHYTLPEASWFWLGLAGLFIAGILLSGFYPAAVLAHFKPVTVLKGKFSGSSRGNFLRKSLVVFQFLASLVLITGTFIVYQELDYLQNQDLGFSFEQTLIVPTPSYSRDSVRQVREFAFKNALSNESFVSSISNSTAVPGRTPDWNAGGLRLASQPESQGNQYRVVGMDDEFIDFYGLEVLSGRGFDDSYGSESGNILLNESAVKRLGFTNPDEVLNQDFVFWGDTFQIVGILKDFRQESPKTEFDALVFRYFPSPNGMYSIGIQTGNMKAALDRIKQHWEIAYGDKPLDYFFLDDYYNEQYRAELRFGSIFSIFSGLAIFVACLGLFGLAAYMITFRTREVGIRKVLGASFPGLLVMLTGDFLKLVGLAIVLSIPLTWWIMNEWLQNFANRISLSPWHFLLPAMGLVVLAIITVSFHTFYTVGVNPAKILKEE